MPRLPRNARVEWHVNMVISETKEDEGKSKGILQRLWGESNMIGTGFVYDNTSFENDNTPI